MADHDPRPESAGTILSPRPRIVIFGASGGTGQAVIRAALDKGFEVAAFVRTASSVAPRDRLEILKGDVTNEASVARAIVSGDLVVVTLGNSQNPFRRMLGEKRTTPPNVCEIGTRNVISAMTMFGAKRLVVVSAFGVGDTRKKAPWLLKLFYAVLLREQMADKERQEPLVKASGLDWTIVQPVALTDDPGTGRWLASPTGNTGAQKICRDDVAAFIVAELFRQDNVGATVTLSGVRLDGLG